MFSFNRNEEILQALKNVNFSSLSLNFIFVFIAKKSEVNGIESLNLLQITRRLKWCKSDIAYYNNCRSGASEASEGTTLYNRTIKVFARAEVGFKGNCTCPKFGCKHTS